MDEKQLISDGTNVQSMLQEVIIDIPEFPKNPKELVVYLSKAPRTGPDKLRTIMRKSLYLKSYAASWGKNSFATHDAGVTKQIVSLWKTSDPKFAEAVHQIDEHILDQLELIVDEKILIDKNDAWLMRKLQAARPEKWAPAPAQLKMGGTITIHLDEDHDSTSQDNSISVHS